ncbi:hypothetical protein BMS3Bbin01_01912 [bacterium BMS3Bbin01]|nr:hypothetical protein BMS3Bbin01_01912 [bacterium BMS3Bbin01]
MAGEVVFFLVFLLVLVAVAVPDVLAGVGNERAPAVLGAERDIRIAVHGERLRTHLHPAHRIPHRLVASRRVRLMPRLMLHLISHCLLHSHRIRHGLTLRQAVPLPTS